jgi:methylenetetrahydrofolate dehydrogenase (NADP+)/methenyltetrahydrofolate cyclohydrolase
MSARLIDGKAVAAEIRLKVAAESATFTARTGIVPHLAAVLVGEDPASAVYVRNKQTACEKAGIKSTLHRLDAATSTEQLLALPPMAFSSSCRCRSRLTSSGCWTP